jgi:hypothetical protein
MNYEDWDDETEFGSSVTFAFYVTLVVLTIPILCFEAVRLGVKAMKYLWEQFLDWLILPPQEESDD